MYLEYFGLEKEPFSITPDPAFLYWSKQHERIRESLLYGIRQRKGFLLLTGEIGTGKTTLCREIVSQINHDTEVSIILNPLLSTFGLLKAINNDFGNRVRGKTSEEQLQRLNEFLLKKMLAGRNAVVIIDEAQNLPFEALEMIRLLSNIETDTQKLLQIVLVGQPELEETLQSYALRQLNQRIIIRQRLDILDFDEIRNYIESRLQKSGYKDFRLFDNKVLRAIYKYTKGSPRMTNILCDRMLLAAFARRTRILTKETIKDAIIDLEGGLKRSWWRRR